MKVYYFSEMTTITGHDGANRTEYLSHERKVRVLSGKHEPYLVDWPSTS